MHMYGIYKNGTNKTICREGIETNREWTCAHIGMGGMNWEIVIDIYTPSIPCIKQITSGKLLQSTGSSAWCSVMT